MDPPDSPNRRRSQDYRRRKADSRKILSRITYNPKKHKQRKTRRELWNKLQQSEPPAPPSIPNVHNTMKFGSFNVNGLDVEAAWAVEKLLKDRGFDVIIRIFSVSK